MCLSTSSRRGLIFQGGLFPSQDSLRIQGMCLQVMNGSICKRWESAVCFNRQLLFAPVRITEKFPALIGGHRIFQSMMQQIKGGGICQRRKKNRPA